MNKVFFMFLALSIAIAGCSKTAEPTPVVEDASTDTATDTVVGTDADTVSTPEDATQSVVPPEDVTVTK